MKDLVQFEVSKEISFFPHPLVKVLLFDAPPPHPPLLSSSPPPHLHLTSTSSPPHLLLTSSSPLMLTSSSSSPDPPHLLSIYSISSSHHLATALCTHHSPALVLVLSRACLPAPPTSTPQTQVTLDFGASAMRLIDAWQAMPLLLTPRPPPASS